MFTIYVGGRAFEFIEDNYPTWEDKKRLELYLEAMIEAELEEEKKNKKLKDSDKKSEV